MCMWVCWGYLIPPYSPPNKTQGPNIFLTEDMAHYVFSYKTIYVSITISMQPHTYVHITHNISTHKIECPMGVVTLDKSNCGKVAHIYIND